MRYGTNKAHNLEIDPTARRKPGQSLKKAAPGAPFGWNADGAPYIGTQYRVSPDGTRFASVSTRNGGEQEYWKPISTLTARVAISAIETHGKLEHLLGMDVAPQEFVSTLRSRFVGLIGEQRMTLMEQNEETAAEAEAVTEVESVMANVKSEAHKAVKAEELKPEPKDTARKTKMMTNGECEGSATSATVGRKRKARMVLADKIREEDAACLASTRVRDANGKVKLVPHMVD